MIRGAENLSGDQLRDLLDGGEASLVRFPYVVSAVLATFQYESPVQLVRSENGRYLKAIPYILSSMLCGWWGFPWGPLLTAKAIWECLNGGRDVTDDVLEAEHAA